MSKPAWINVGPQDSIGAATVQSAGDTLTIVAHGLSEGDIVMVDSLTGGAVGPLIPGAVYFARNPTADTFQLSGTRGSQLKEFASDGTAEVFAAIPQYSAVDLRRNDAVLLWGGTADPLGSRAGVRPHSTPVVTVAGTTWSVNEHAGVVYPAVSATSAAYRYHQLDDSGSLDPAHGSLDRIDALDLEVQDDDEDGSGFRRSHVVYTAGTAAASPEPPALVSGRLRLATIAVGSGGSPAPTVATLAQFAVASGGILPTRNGETLPSAGLVEGTYADQGGALLRWTGANWTPAASPSSPTMVTFTSSGSFDKSDHPWARKVRVRVQGGGGGGGGTGATGSGEAATAGGGGGGGYAEAIIDVADLEASVTVTVGAGGNGGTAGNNSGQTGADSVFGAHVSGSGGGGGQGGAATAGRNITDGGNGGGGQINTGVGFVRPGGGGHNGGNEDGLIANFGHGGESTMGPGARVTGSNVGGSGVIGGTYGGGGSGALASPSQGAFAGGNGRVGIVIVEVL